MASVTRGTALIPGSFWLRPHELSGSSLALRVAVAPLWHWQVHHQAPGTEKWRTPTHRVSYSKPHPAKYYVSLPGTVAMCCLQLK